MNFDLKNNLDYTESWVEYTGEECSKTWTDKFYNGFWEKYCNGKGIDIGGRGYLQKEIKGVLPTSAIIDLSTPGYDGRTLPFESESLDYTYSSHFLEHVDDYQNAFREQFRVLKKGGHIVMSVPHRDLYEKKESLPSRYNGDHRRFYTPASLLREVEESLVPNTYRVRLLEDNDKGFDYSIPPEVHSCGCYEITLVIQKL